MSYYIRSSKRNDCYELAKTLRQQDVQEVFASGGRNPSQALIRAYLTSHLHCYTIILDDKVVGMFGISKHLQRIRRRYKSATTQSRRFNILG